MADPREGAEEIAFTRYIADWGIAKPLVPFARQTFAAGFAAGLATTPDPATVAAMRRLLWRVLTDIDDDFDGFSSVRDDIIRFFGRDPDTEPWPSIREATDGPG